MVFSIGALLLGVITSVLALPQATPNTTSALRRAPLASSGCGKDPITSGTYSLNIDGENRQYILQLPDNYDPNTPYKLIFGLHWYGGTMTDVATGQTVERDTWAFYGLQRLAENTAIFVAPQGIDNTWSATNDDDFQFIDGIIQTLEDGLCVDQNLRFATGFSNGAAFSYYLACSRPDVFRAVAVLSGGSLSGNTCGGSAMPVAYLGIHGVRDPALNIALGRTLRDTFVRANGCTLQDAPEPVEASLTHVKTEYEGCQSGYPVTWIAFDEGHIAAPHDGGTGDSGSQTFSPGETWNFFSQF
ncbi:hypothetical protein VNI00_004914 [Paramarasmius palmivorus]|uniref:Feruloyl esterase C n=1 Tax=Paramarasmius palmivorus TaxID=297713 RepID=A0AAW0DF64_9AGAR